MTVKDLTTLRERILERIEKMDEAELLEVERVIDDIRRRALLEHRIALLRQVTGIISDPEDIRVLEEETRRRSIYGDRPLDLEP